MALSRPSGFAVAKAGVDEDDLHHITRAGMLGDIVELPIAKLRFDLSPREVVRDEKHAAVLAEVLPDLPPIVVHAPSLHVIDGVHRVMAARLRGEETVRGRLLHCNEVEATVQAVHCNVVHGKPLTTTEREAAAKSILDLQPEWSDRRIATVCGLSPMTIGRIRGRSTDSSGQLRARVGRDGKSRPTDPAQMRRHIADAIEGSPSASTRQIAEHTGASQATVRDVRTRMQRGDDILTPRLARDRSRQQSPTESRRDRTAAGAAHEGNGSFRSWFDARRLRADDWEPFVHVVPISHVYEVADQARQSADAWRRFADALEARARKHRRRPR